MPDWRKVIDVALGQEQLDPSRVSEVRDEIAEHLDDRYHALLAEGSKPDDAEQKVIAELQQEELGAELRSMLKPTPRAESNANREGLFSSVWRDLRYGSRQLRLSPVFTFTALLSLVLGIGANTAIFELVNAVRMRTLPVRKPQELFLVKIVSSQQGRVGSFRAGVSDFTTNMFEALRTQQRGFGSLAAWSVNTVDLSRSAEVRYGRLLFASDNLFDVLGVRAIRGRLINSGDDYRGCTSPPAVVSYAYWQTEMGGRTSAIGEHVWVNRHSFEVVGITPPSFFGLEVGRRFAIALPVCAEPIVLGEGSLYDSAKGWWLGTIGRLQPGMTLQTASAQLSAMSPAIMQSTIPPEYNSQQRAAYMELKLGLEPAATGYSRLRKTYDRPFWILLGISLIVLLVACANLANVMLARTSARKREIAVRIALGASRSRLVRQLLLESLLLAAIGAIAGAALAQLLSRALVPFLGTKDQHIFVDLHLDWRVLTFTVALALITCVLFGLSPALQASRVAPGEVLQAAGRGIVAARSRFELRRMLVAAQIALSLSLVIAAFLFIGTFRNLLTADSGFQPDDLVVANVDFSSLRIPPAERLAHKQQLTDAVAKIPGVISVARNRFEPVNGGAWNENINISRTGISKQTAWFNEVSPGYFSTIGNPLIAGRDFNKDDSVNSPKVAIVSRAFATKYFREPNPCGKTFGVVQYGDKPDEVYQVVGVAGDLKYSDLRGDFEPLVYVPDAQSTAPESETLLMVRADQRTDVLVPEIRRGLLQVNSNLVLQFSTMKDDIADGLVTERLMAVLAGFFGVLALALAIIGVYGVIAYTVARRTNEIGIRMALGARREKILLLLMKEVAVISAIGTAGGIALTAAAGPAARSLLFGLRPLDPSVVVLSVVAVFIVSGFASLVPALRAAQLNPMVALRVQ